MPPTNHLLLLDSQVKQVQSLAGKHLEPHLIKIDLKFTGSVNDTVDRILDNQFLHGTERDPQRDIEAWGKEDDGGVWRGLRRKGSYNYLSSSPEVRKNGGGAAAGASSEAPLQPPRLGSPRGNGDMDGRSSGGTGAGAGPGRSGNNTPPPPSQPRPLDDGYTIYLSDSDSDAGDDMGDKNGSKNGNMDNEARNVRASLSKMAAVSVLAESSGNAFSMLPSQDMQAPPLSPPTQKGKGKGRASDGMLDKGKGKAKVPVQTEQLGRPLRAAEDYGAQDNVSRQSRQDSEVPSQSPPRKRIRESVSTLLPESPLFQRKEKDIEEEEAHEILEPAPKKRRSETVVLDLTLSSDEEMVAPKPVVPKPKSKPKPPSRIEPDPLGLGDFGGAFDDDFLDIDHLQPPPRARPVNKLPPPVQAAAPKLVKGLSAATLKLLAERNSEGSDDNEDLEGSTTKSRKRTVMSKSSTAGAATKRQKASLPVLPESERSTLALSATASPKKPRRTVSGDGSSRRTAEKDPEKEQRKREREEAAAEKRREKDAAKEQRRLEKEAQAAEKRREQEFASVNKVVRNKKDSAPEMIVDMSRALVDTVTGEQAQGFLTHLGCEVNPNWRPAIGTESEWKVIKWRRKTKAKYDQQQRMFMPLPEEVVEDEKHVMVYLTAKEFVDIAFPDEGMPGLDEHVRKMRRLVPAAGSDVKLLYLIEGLTVFVRKCVNAANKAAREEAERERAGEEASRRRKPKDKSINEDQAEDALLQLQVVHNCLVHHTVAPIESAEWISIFTGDISTIPYKNARLVLDTAFCTEVGQVKTGTDRKDTYIKMLQEIHRVTPAIAKGIEREYPDVMALVKAFRTEGVTAVGDLAIFAGRSGGTRNVGSAMSKKIAEVFLGTDPAAAAET